MEAPPHILNRRFVQQERSLAIVQNLPVVTAENEALGKE